MEGGFLTRLRAALRPSNRRRARTVTKEPAAMGDKKRQDRGRVVTSVVVVLAAACLTLLALLHQAHAEIDGLKELVVRLRSEMVTLNLLPLHSGDPVGSIMLVVAIFNIIGVLAFAAYGIKTRYNTVRPIRGDQCTLS